MEPGPPEVARTLARGVLPAVIHVRSHPGRLPVRQVTGADGTPLLLAPTAGELAAALLPAGAHRNEVVLSVDDVPPVAGAPWRGRLWLTGRAERLVGAGLRPAAMSFAEVNPVGDLLDVGRGQDLYRVHVTQVQLAHGSRLSDVEPEEFRAARPDPLHDDERDLLTHLTAHHGRHLAALVGRLAGGRPAADCRAVRLDRHGLDIAVGARKRLRVGFPCPVRDRGDLAHALHSLLCGGTRPAVAGTDRRSVPSSPDRG